MALGRNAQRRIDDMLLAVDGDAPAQQIDRFRAGVEELDPIGRAAIGVGVAAVVAGAELVDERSGLRTGMRDAQKGQCCDQDPHSVGDQTSEILRLPGC